MFYTKTVMHGRITIISEIHDNNVYTTCPGCGRELSVCLADVFADEEADLEGTVIFCEACSKNM